MIPKNFGMKSKFYGIVYPFYGSYFYPDRIIYGPNDLSVEVKGRTYIVDINYLRTPSYLQTLFSLDNKEKKRLSFHITARNTSELLRSPNVKWGIDNKGKQYDLRSKTSIPCVCRKVVKVINTKFWLQGISYPFEVADYLKSTEDLESIYAITVNIDMQHHIYEFTTLYDERMTIII